MDVHVTARTTSARMNRMSMSVGQRSILRLRLSGTSAIYVQAKKNNVKLLAI